MLTLPYTSRDYESIFNGIKEIMQTIEPKIDVNADKANVETIIAKIIAGCVDTLSYNQDANILEAFPSTSRDARAVFDLLSIVGYTPKTARCCHLIMTLWNPSYIGERTYMPYSSISVDNKTFYCPDEFSCAPGMTTTVNWYQGALKSPDVRNNIKSETVTSFVDNYYPNLSINVIKNRLYKLPEEHTKIDSETIRIYTEDGTKLIYVENPYLTNITKSSFSIMPSVNKSGYSFMFSEDVAGGGLGENFYYFYLISEGYDVGNNIVPDFSGLAYDKEVPSFSQTYEAEAHKEPETADEARNNVVYEFGWRDTPKAIITKYDAERAVLQNFKYIAAVDVRDGNDYSKCDPKLFDIRVFCKVNEDYEQRMSLATADGIINRLQTHFNKFKMLPLNFTFRIDDIVLDIDAENYDVTQLYYWYPDITIYLKEQVDSQGAAAILNAVNEALFERYKTTNVGFNEVPRIVDILDTVQNASDMVLYLDVDGLYFIDSKGMEATKEDITCTFNEYIESQGEEDNVDYTYIMNTKEGTRRIMFNTVKIVNSFNEVIAYDNGDGVLMASGSYLDGVGSVDYETGKVTFKLKAPLAEGNELRIYYRQETPCYCEYINLDTKQGIKIALESLKP